MAVAITIRNVPEAVRDVYAERARRAGMSLQEHLLRFVIERANKPVAADYADELSSWVVDHGVRVDVDEMLDGRDDDGRSLLR